MELFWLPEPRDFDSRLRELDELSPEQAVEALRSLANSRLSFLQTNKLDKTFVKLQKRRSLIGLEPLKLAVLGSATTAHLASGIRVGGLRRGFAIEVYECSYGLYWQELMDEASSLHAFRPDVLLLALDARHLVWSAGATAASAIDLMRSCWRRAKTAFSCQVLQQTVLPVFEPLMGNNESRITSSPAYLVSEINHSLPEMAAEEGVDLLALHQFMMADGLDAWYEPATWHRSKHEVHPRAAAKYGDQVGRLIAAGRGRSSKCLVLDLDNTLWGGVIGDDGLEGIVLGQGSGTGEAFIEFQRYVLQLSDRGVILAVCSKNDEANALAPFEKHPEMVLARNHISCFTANWTDKATNLRQIAKTLNIGLDSLVFADDNPIERELIRRELPMVAVPEIPADPADYVRTLSAGGYFEELRLTEEDRARMEQYQANAERARLAETVTDMAAYLASLNMVLTAAPFDNMVLPRVVQLINKTNQFNLTTQRLNEAEVRNLTADPQAITLQVRLADRFGDNGLIAVLIARVNGDEAVVESWLMSCRVLGRRVEEACLTLLAGAARKRGAHKLHGIYKPSTKNCMVSDLYSRLGFTSRGPHSDDETHWELNLATFKAPQLPMQIVQPL